MPDKGADHDGGTERHIDIEVIDPLSLDEALSIIGEHTRANIIIALGEARTTDPAAPNSLRFSDLMKRVDVEDSGRFNYHLDKLVGTFVKKSDEGYALRLPGQLIYQAVVAGTLTDRRTIERFPVGDCPDCDGQLSAAYHPDHLLTVECVSCQMLFDAVHFPSRGLADRSNRKLLDAAYQRRHAKVETMRRGVCLGCGGVVERALQPSASITYGSASVEEMAGLETYAVLACTGCNTSLVGHPANIALTAPAVVGFFADQNRDVVLARWWDDPIVAAREGIEVIGKDPRAVAMVFEIDGDRLRIVLDDDLQVVKSERIEG
ncbi:hypothetical protein [Haloferax sp. KTX1]|uniref:DUF7351 domain-containing protein n=1 Tax=Haloferax sp. KTX1 TaxID=2600597 RepID=UPI0011DD4CB5|nr:hypothetical protein [Haloferax sp. KTX1]